MTRSIDLTSSEAVLGTMLEGNTYSNGAIGRSVTLLATATAKTDARAHATAIAILYRSLPQDMGGDRDCSQAVRLVEALGKGGRAQAMVQWFHRHTNIRIRKDAKNGTLSAGMLNEKMKLYRALSSDDIAAARSDPYWNKPSVEGANKLFTDETLISRITRLIADAEKDGATVEHVANVAFLDSARRLVAAAKLADPLAIAA